VRNTWVEHAALEVRLLVAVALEEDPAWRTELGLELARERQRRGWILHAWGDLVPVAYAMQSAGHLDTALLLALAARRSPTGDGDAHFLDPLLGALHESIGQDEAERIAEEVDGLDLSALIRIAEGVRLTPAG